MCTHRWARWLDLWAARTKDIKAAQWCKNRNGGHCIPGVGTCLMCLCLYVGNMYHTLYFLLVYSADICSVHHKYVWVYARAYWCAHIHTSLCMGMYIHTQARGHSLIATMMQVHARFVECHFCNKVYRGSPWPSAIRQVLFRLWMLHAHMHMMPT